jgi:hypothetical protein
MADLPILLWPFCRYSCGRSADTCVADLPTSRWPICRLTRQPKSRISESPLPGRLRPGGARPPAVRRRHLRRVEEELKLDVVGVAENQHGRTRHGVGRRDRGVSHRSGRQPVGPGIEFRPAGHRKRQVVQSRVRFVERAAETGPVLRQPEPHGQPLVPEEHRGRLKVGPGRDAGGDGRDRGHRRRLFFPVRHQVAVGR